MSLKRTFSRTLLKPAVRIAIFAGGVLGATTAINAVVNHDLDEAPVVQNKVTDDYKTRLRALESLHNRHHVLEDKIYDSDSETSRFLAREEAQKARIRYVESANQFGLEHIGDPQINEMTYRQFARHFPKHSTQYSPEKNWADSLQECRVQYSTDIVGTEEQIKRGVASCASSNNWHSGMLTLFSLIASIFIFMGLTDGIDNSRTLKKWASEPKRRKPKPN